jgi:hypothetical protein
MGVYCTAWTYFGSIGRAASAGLWFLPIYLGPTLGMLLAWMLLRKMIRIARVHRITSIADFIGSRYGKSRLLAALVTLIAVVGIVPYVALQLKAIATGYSLLTSGHAWSGGSIAGVAWWRDSTLYIALVLAGFTIAFGTRPPRHHRTPRGNGRGDRGRVGGQAARVPRGRRVRHLGPVRRPGRHLHARLGAPDLQPCSASAPRIASRRPVVRADLALDAVAVLPAAPVPDDGRRERRRASRAARRLGVPAVPAADQLFVLPIALGGLLHPVSGAADAETFVLSLPLAAGHSGLALFAFIGGLSAATGMIIVEAIAVSTMVCNDLVIPLLLAAGRAGARPHRHAARHPPRRDRRAAAARLSVLPHRRRGVRARQHRLISFAAVAQFAPALLGGMYWKGGTRAGALAGLGAGFALWVLHADAAVDREVRLDAAGFMTEGLFGIALLRPEHLFGLSASTA